MEEGKGQRQTNKAQVNSQSLTPKSVDVDASTVIHKR